MQWLVAGISGICPLLNDQEWVATGKNKACMDAVVTD
jgi:hypothetical protein